MWIHKFDGSTLWRLKLLQVSWPFPNSSTMTISVLAMTLEKKEEGHEEGLSPWTKPTCFPESCSRFKFLWPDLPPGHGDWEKGDDNKV